MYGSDQAASISVEVLKSFVSDMRLIPKILGDGEKNLTEKEKLARNKLRVEVE